MDQVTFQNEHWKSHYTRQHALIDKIGVTKSHEYSNEIVQLQTYAHSLEALGRVDGLSIMDAGCGWGCFTLLLHALGARAVDCLLERHAAHRLRCSRMVPRLTPES